MKAIVHGYLPMEERILFQNKACMVTNKLPGESSEFPEAGAGNGEEKFPAPVHRLDVPVSGCLLLAKTPEASAFLGEAFAKPAAGNGPERTRNQEPKAARLRIEKRYWAIIEKSPAAAALPPEGELVHWLYTDMKTNKSFAVPANDKTGRAIPQPRRGKVKPKKAVLRYRLTGQGEHYFFLEIDLVTGRHHQIRAQLAALDLHIKGDLKYGAKRSEKGGGIKLHAYSLAFPNPLDQNEIICVEALPPAMDSLWTAFAEAAGL